MDAELKKLIADGKCYICQNHFKLEDIEHTSKSNLTFILIFMGWGEAGAKVMSVERF